MANLSVRYNYTALYGCDATACISYKIFLLSFINNIVPDQRTRGGELVVGEQARKYKPQLNIHRFMLMRPRMFNSTTTALQKNSSPTVGNDS